MTDVAAELKAAAPRFLYRVFGLDVASDLELPELVPGGDGGDVTISLARIDHRPPVSANGAGFEVVPSGDVFFRYLNVGTMLVHDGQSIVVDAEPSADERALRLFLTGPVLASILHQRGLLVLHASALAIGRRAVGFLGAPRAGKSTTAAAMYSRGHAVLSDDLLPIDCSLEQPLAVPGFPQLKLWPEVLASLGENPDAVPPLRAGLVKRSRTVVDRFARRPCPLERLYVLEPAPRVAIARLRPAAATLQLVRHSYFGPELPLLGRKDAHLAQCAYVARTVPVRVLERPPGLAVLGAVSDVVERDLAAQDARAARTL